MSYRPPKLTAAELQRMSDALPADFNWSDPLHPNDLREILSAMGYFDLIESVRDLIAWVPGPSHWHTDAAPKAVDRAIAVVAKATGAQP